MTQKKELTPELQQAFRNQATEVAAAAGQYTKEHIDLIYEILVKSYLQGKAEGREAEQEPER